MIGKTNCGNANRASFDGALVHVIAPSNSTISFVNENNIVVKVLRPQEGHTKEKDALFREWYYSINPSNYGTWTIIADNNTSIFEQIINIDSNKQYDVHMVENLYSQGYTFPIAEDFIKSSTTASGWNNGTINKELDRIDVILPSGNYAVSCSSYNSIDLTSYNNVYFDIYNTSGTFNFRDIAITNTKSITINNESRTATTYANAVVAYTVIDADGLFKIDIRSLTGNFYISALACSRVGTQFSIRRIYLER